MASGKIAAVPTIRVNHVFFVLMVFSILTAFVLPPGCATPVQSPLMGLFSPVSRPARAMAAAIDGRIHRVVPTDDGSPANPRPVSTVYAENHELRAQLVSLQVKFDALSKLNADRQSVGDIRNLCEPATVTGSDPSGLREALLITPSSLFREKQPVIHSVDLVGSIYRAGLTGAQVRLITDPGFSFTAKIGRFVIDADGHPQKFFVDELHPLVQGVGHGMMAVRSTISMEQASRSKIAVNDFVVLNDNEWPANLQGFNVGRITSIHAQRNAPLFAEIQIEPSAPLMRLTDVMVMVRN